MEKPSVYLPFSEVTDSRDEMTFSSEEVGKKRLFLRRKTYANPHPSRNFSYSLLLFSRNVRPGVFKQVLKYRAVITKLKVQLQNSEAVGHPIIPKRKSQNFAIKSNSSHPGMY